MNPTDRDTGPRGDTPADVMDTAEIRYESGALRFRFSRYFSADGRRWVRHGPFVAYHENGAVATQGAFIDGLEDGTWRDYHPNGRMAAEGVIYSGKAEGYWCYYDESGTEVAQAEYDHGEKVGAWAVPLRTE